MKREIEALPLLEKFIRANRNGRRMQKNGKRISAGSNRNYIFLEKQLRNFCIETGFSLRFLTGKNLNRREHETEKKYWQKFYLKFTAYLYDEQKYYDNYVGMLFKLFRSFVNYLNNDLGMSVGNYHKSFYVYRENIPIITISQERLRFLISDKKFEDSLPLRLQKTKAIFVFGCTVALRVSDLMNLRQENLENYENRTYLVVTSKKTRTTTRIKLPDYAIDILQIFPKDKKRLLPYFHNVYLNKYVKELCERAGWTEPVFKMRTRRGVPCLVGENQKVYRFCDLVTSHTMRRTAITTMLTLGMNEHLVRKISGHTPNSNEFEKYVNYSQSFFDDELDRTFEKLHQTS